jgi:DNA sulfur modification protein DndB
MRCRSSPSSPTGRIPRSRAAPASSSRWARCTPHCRPRFQGTSCGRQETRQIAVAFWSEVTAVMPGWRAATEGKIKEADLREKYIHAHAVALEALGRAGNALFRDRSETWNIDLAALASIDWSRTNPLWSGPAIINGRVAKNQASVVLIGNAIKKHIGRSRGGGSAA